MKVPLLDVTPPPEFGEVITDPRFGDPHGADFAPTYVPGFSDMRRDRDLALGRLLKGEIAAKDVPTLPVNLRWVRSQRVSGEPDNTKLWTAGQRGYKPVQASDVGQPWLTELPLGARQDANGMIRNGDTVLCVATKEDAARNELRKAHQTQQRTAAATESFSAALAKQRVNTKGTEPTVEVIPTKRKEK